MIRSLLAIDSGHPACACAEARGERLTCVGWAEPGDILGQFDRVVVEIPAMRPDTPDGNDLIAIAVAGARLAQGSLREGGVLTEYRPAEWKGNTPKPAHHARMLDALLDAEYALLGGDAMKRAVEAACRRGAQDRWRKPGARYYRASELPTVGGTKITHDILDAAALALYALGRIRKG